MGVTQLSLRQGVVLALAGGGGALLAWRLGEPLALLVVIAGISRFIGWRAGSVATVALAAMCAAALPSEAAWTKTSVFVLAGLGLALLMRRDTQELAADPAVHARLIVEKMPGMGWAVDPQGRHIYVSPSVLAYQGLSQPELDPVSNADGFGWEQLLPPDQAKRVAQEWLHSLRTGEPYNTRHQIRRNDGVYRWFRVYASPARDPGGAIVAWYGTAIDIDDEVRAQEALRERERQLRQLIDAVPTLLWSAAPDCTPGHVNRRLKEWIGRELPDFLSPDLEQRAKALQVLIHPDDLTRVILALSHAFDTGDDFRERYRMRRADGVFRWVEGRAEALRDEEGRIAQWYGIILDVDEEVRAREALSEREQQLTQLIDTVPAMMCCFNPEGQPSYYSRKMVEWLGHGHDEFDDPNFSRRLTTIAAFIHPDDAQHVNDSMTHAIASGLPFDIKFRARRADGAYRWLNGRTAPLRDQDGRILHWYGICLDIDDEVRANETLRRRERELANIVDTIPAMLCSFTPDGEPAYYSKRLIEWLGHNHDEVESVPGLSRREATHVINVHPDDVNLLNERMMQSIRSGALFSLEFRGRRADGVYRWLKALAEPLRDHEGNIVQWYAICLDIDDELKAQEALKARERELSLLIDTVPSMMWILTPEGSPYYYNRALTDWLGIRVADPDRPGMSRFEATIEEIIHVDDAPLLVARLQQSFATGQTFRHKYRVRCSDGTYRWTDGRAEPLRDVNGQIIRWYGVNNDIHDEVLAQEKLQERERQLSLLVDAVPSLIWCVTPAGEPSYYNRRLADWLGFEVDRLPGTGMDRLSNGADVIVHPDHRDMVYEGLRSSLQTGTPFRMKYRQRRADGVYRWTEGLLEPLRDENGRIMQWYGVVLDIEDEVSAQEALKKTQDKLARASEAASLAELSASIAHEVNQPLTAIITDSYACQRWLSMSPPNISRARMISDRIVIQANSASDIVNRVKDVFQQKNRNHSVTDINALIVEVCQLLRNESGRSRVVVECELDAALPKLRVDRVQIQQVLVNLVRNAMEATSEVAGDSGRVQIRTTPLGEEQISVAVADNGCGIDDPDKIFDAFYTTKHNGMGMGLAICRSIVHAHRGQLWVEKNTPQGARFIFTLPCNHEE